jgi:hypothetical protein
MSASFGFFELPAEIRFMIYRLLFCPSTEPILISFLLAGPIKRSAQILRISRACQEEASPVLYGQNQFALDWAYSGTESSILEFFENVGSKNRHLIRHLRARHFSIWTLDKIRKRRSLRPVLENLQSLSLEFFKSNRFVNVYLPRKGNGVAILQDIQKYLRTRRGPYKNLVQVFKTATEDLAQGPTLRVCLASIAAKPNPEVGKFLLLVSSCTIDRALQECVLNVGAEIEALKTFRRF